MDFLDFVYQGAKAQQPAGHAKSPDVVRVNDAMMLQQLMVILTMDGEIPILLQIGHQIFDYHSHLKMATGKGESEKSMYLLIDALTPSIGNMRIRHADVITIGLNTKAYNVVMNVNFIEQIDSDVLKITFPKEVLIRTEKRKSVRVNIDPTWNVVLDVAIGRKETFKPSLENISFGGFYFKAPKQHPRLFSGQECTAHFIWSTIKLDTKITIKIIEACKARGTPFFRAHYAFEIYDRSMQKMESLVAYAQSLHLQRRNDFGQQWELRLNKKLHR